MRTVQVDIQVGLPPSIKSGLAGLFSHEENSHSGENNQDNQAFHDLVEV